MQIHQVTWDKREPRTLHCRRLSCLTCPPGAVCCHYDLSCISLDLLPHNVHVEIPASTPVPSAIPSPLLSLPSPLMSPNWTPIVQQLLHSLEREKGDTQRIDSEKPTCSKILRGPKSRKRIRFADVYSDSSCSPPISRPETPIEVHQAHSQQFWSSSEDEDILSTKKT